MSVPEKAVDNNSMEREIQKKCNALGCELLKNALETWDDALAATT